METLEGLQRRSRAQEDLLSLVRTMKALAAVGVHQGDRVVRALAVYRRTVELGLHVALRDLEPWPAPPRVPRDASQGALVLGSDHGLCGRFNADIVEHALGKLALSRDQGAPIRIAAVGARTALYLDAAGFPPEAVVAAPGTPARLTAAVRQVLLRIETWRAEGVQRVRLFHHARAASTRHRPTTQRLLPFDFARFRRLEEEPWPTRVLPACGMERSALLASLVNQHLFVTIFRACGESLASENGARLAAMQAADTNLTEHGQELAAELRKVRQGSITAELLDVASGYEAIVQPGLGGSGGAG